MSFGEFYKKLYEDNDQDESGQELGGDENKSCTDVQYNNTEERTRIPEITTEELQTAIDQLKRQKSQTAMVSEPKTLKQVKMKREKL